MIPRESTWSSGRRRRDATSDRIHERRPAQDHERKLIKKVKDLNGEIVNNASKVHTALKLSQDDQQTITTLRSEVEKAWKMVDTAQSKETAAKETITSLKEEIANLSGLVEKSAALTGTQEGMVQELTAARDELQRQTEEATGTCKVLETQLTNMTEVLEGERLECATLRGDKADLEQSLAARSAEVQRGQRSKERLDKELKNTLKLLEARTGEQEALQSEATEAKAHGKELETQLNDARNTMDKYLRDYDTLYQRTQKLTEDLEGAAPASRKLCVLRRRRRAPAIATARHRDAPSHRVSRARHRNSATTAERHTRQYSSH